jgi:hypothetical protein
MKALQIEIKKTEPGATHDKINKIEPGATQDKINETKPSIIQDSLVSQYPYNDDTTPTSPDTANIFIQCLNCDPCIWKHNKVQFRCSHAGAVKA